MKPLVSIIALACLGLGTAVPQVTASASPPPAAAPQADPAAGPHALEQAAHASDPLRLTPLPSRPSGAAGPTLASGACPGGFSPRPLTREVFGFAPYYELSQEANWRYQLLSTVAYFGLTLDANGNWVTTNPDGTPESGYSAWTTSTQLGDMVSRAHQAGARVVLVVKQFDEATINSLITSPTAVQNAINNAISAAQSKCLDGINVDFEGHESTTYPNIQTDYTNFIHAFSDAMHQRWPGAFFTVDTYSGSASWDQGFMNISALAPYVDAFFVMAYDMASGNLPGQAGPNAPLNGWTYNDTTAVTQYLGKAPASKIILGVPYYGKKWSTTTNQPYGTIVPGTDAMSDTYSAAVDDLTCGAQQLSQGWDSTAQAPWAAWWSPATGDPCGGNHGSWRELYYDNADSLLRKYDLVNRTNIRGTGIWALGYDGTYPELWGALDTSFVSWSDFESLGGTIQSAPDVSTWGPGRLDVFALGSDKTLMHTWYDGAWHAWESLGGTLTSAPGVVAWAPGRIDVFARGQNNELIHKYYNGTWSGWESLGGVLAGGARVASWGSGRLDVFAWGADNALWHHWYDGGAWRGWESLGGVLADAPAAVSWGPGRIDAFVEGADHLLWHRWYSGGWSGWDKRGGQLASGPAAASWGPGRLDVFMQGSDNALWQLFWNGSSWQWQYLGGTLAAAPGAVSWGVNRLDVFARATDNTLLHKWYHG